MISQGDVWWTDLPDPTGSGPGHRRPVVVVQGDPLNRSRVSTVVCAVVTSNLKWAKARDNVRLPARESGLKQDSVVTVSQIPTLDRSRLADRVDRASLSRLSQVLTGIDVVLGR